MSLQAYWRERFSVKPTWPADDPASSAVRLYLLMLLRAQVDHSRYHFLGWSIVFGIGVRVGETRYDD